jgi:hypothetical protein
VDGPVAAPGLAVFAGAVERIDDPDPAARQAARIERPLLREDRVAGMLGDESSDDQLVGASVALGAEPATVARAAVEPCAKLEEGGACRRGDARGIGVIPGRDDELRL